MPWCNSPRPGHREALPAAALHQWKEFAIMSEDVLFEVEGPVAIITLNRPARLNAINSGIRSGLAEAWQRFEQDDALKVATLTGSGEKAFCAGMDLKEAAATGTGVPPH